MHLATLTDKQLLKVRVRDLPGLRDGRLAARLRPYVDGLHAELAAIGFAHFRPEVYLGDEWFSPDGVPKIAMPFYLAHPRLKALELRMMREVEGGKPRALRQLLRHESGHAFDHAYGVSRTAEFRRVFGRKRGYRPDVYVPVPDSRDYVAHLPGSYAQAHPDEDFAETFAVVITPDSDWRRRYRDWPGALAKLEYVARLIATHGRRAPRVTGGPECYLASRMRSTLGSYYERRLNAARRDRAAVKKLALRAKLPI